MDESFEIPRPLESEEEALRYLTPEEQRLILDPEDRRIIARTKTMNPEEFKICDRVRPMIAKYGEYFKAQMKWFRENVYFFGINHHRPPTREEEEECYLNQDISRIFCAYYVMKNRTKIENLPTHNID